MKAEIVKDERIGDNQHYVTIWPVLDFSDSVPVETQNRIRPVWNRYAKLRRQIESRFNETTATEMLSFKHAILRILMPEDFPKRPRKTEAAKMARGGAFVSGKYGHGAQWMVKA